MSSRSGCARRCWDPGALGGDTIIVSDQGICIRNFRHASASAPASRLDTDVAAALAAMAVRAGAERTAAAAARVLEADTARGALVIATLEVILWIARFGGFLGGPVPV